MIVAGYFINCDFKQTGNIKANFVNECDDCTVLFVFSNIKRIYDLVSPFEYYIEDVLFLLKLKEIDTSETLVRHWYILDAMVFE